MNQSKLVNEEVQAVTKNRGYRPVAPLRAELTRLLSTPLCRNFLIIGVVPVIVLGLVQTFTGDSQNQVGTSGIDLQAFIVAIASATLVAREYQVGSNSLKRLLEPSEVKNVFSVTVALVALMVASAVLAMVVTTGTSMIVNATVDPVKTDSLLGMLRGALVIGGAALLGSGIGYVTRSTALSAFIVTVLFWVAPLVLLVVGLTGPTWGVDAYQYTFGILVGMAIDPTESSTSVQWASLGLLYAWSVISMILGTLRARS